MDEQEPQSQEATDAQPDQEHQQVLDDLQREQESQQRKSGRRRMIVIIVMGIVLIIVIIVLSWLLRRCTPGSSSASNTAKPAAAVPDVGIANRIHAAIHPTTLPDGKLADTLVYIIDVSRSGSNIVGTIRLNTTVGAAPVPSGTLALVAREFEQVTIAKVPEVTVIQVVDSANVPLSSMSRK